MWFAPNRLWSHGLGTQLFPGGMAQNKKRKKSIIINSRQSKNKIAAIREWAVSYDQVGASQLKSHGHNGAIFVGWKKWHGYLLIFEVGGSISWGRGGRGLTKGLELGAASERGEMESRGKRNGRIQSIISQTAAAWMGIWVLFF